MPSKSLKNSSNKPFDTSTSLSAASSPNHSAPGKLRNFKTTIEYDGAGFKGWQIQNTALGKAGENCRTVQGEFEKVLKKLFGQPVRVIGSGRTDSGVHALGQVASFKAVSRLSAAEIFKALNALLPDDIAVHDIREVPLSFHAQYSVKKKTYRYSILHHPIRSALYRRQCLFYPYPLDINLMRKEAKSLIGRHNFKAFQAADAAGDEAGKPKSTVRTIEKLSIKKKGGFIFIEITANGFLYKMVRNIVGSLLAAGQGRLTQGSIKRILQSKQRAFAGKTAPSHGLCLLRVKY